MSRLFHVEVDLGHCGNNVTVSSAYRNDELNLTAESPWSGDTETGFGRDVTVTLKRAHVEELRDALNDWLAGRIDETD